MMANLETLPR